jgi:hypothetical protein
MQNPMMDRGLDLIANALADLPNGHLWALGDSIKAMPASLVLAWPADLVLWERKRRFGEVPGDLPEPSIPPDQIPVALLLLPIFTGPFRADPNGQEVEPLIRLFEAATVRLEAALGRGGARVQ